MHTPGPWRIGPSSKIWRTYMQTDGRRVHRPVGESFDVAGSSDEERDANALLMASAPDILAALQGLMAFVPAASLTAGPELSAWIAARAAIARATGAA